MSPPPTGTAPLRPSLNRANASTQSVSSAVDSAASDTSSSSSSSGKRRPSMSTARMAALNAASVHSSPLASPTMPRTSSGNQQQLRSYFDGAMAAVDMMRSESSDSQRSLKTKSSRKELKELARSATPSKGRSSNGDDDDDDTRSIESFTCTFTCDFDRQKRAQTRAEAVNGGRGDPQAHQRWLDATFRKLSQKTGIRYNQQLPHHAVKTMRTGEGAMPTIQDVDVVSEAEAFAAKTKAHFLDFSAIISPVPTAGTSTMTSSTDSSNCSGSSALTVPASAGIHSTNSTPRPADYSRFPAPPSAPLSEAPTGLSLHPTLRSRRSEDSLTVRRRAQRQVSASAASGHSFSPPFGELPLAGGQHYPVPQLPDWARQENRRAHGSGSSASGLSSTEMTSTISSDAGPTVVRRPVDMGRAFSHDANASSSLRLSLGPSLMSNFDSWKLASGSEAEIPPSLASSYAAQRSHSSLEHRQAHPTRPIIPPLSFHRHQSSFEDVSPKKRLPSSMECSLNRGSVSSATSDSDIASSISSVPQTPVSRFTTLPASAQNGEGPSIRRDSQTTTLYYDMAETPNVFDVSSQSAAAGVVDEQDHLAAIRTRWMEGSQQSTQPLTTTSASSKTAPPPPPSAYFMTPRFAATRAGQHVARVFEEEQENKKQARSTATLSTKSTHTPAAPNSHSSSDQDGDDTVRSAVRRPRAATLSSSMGPPPMTGAHSQSKHIGAPPTPLSTPISPSRSSSLHHSRSGSVSSTRRTSVASNTSAITTASSTSSASTTSSGASALLSYMRSRPSKSHSNLSSAFDKQHKQKDTGLTFTTSSSSSSSSSKAPSSSGTVRAPSSPVSASSRRGGGILPEDLAASIGRRFGRNIAVNERN